MPYTFRFDLRNGKLRSSGRVLVSQWEGRGFEPRPMEVVSKLCQVNDCWRLVNFMMLQMID